MQAIELTGHQGQESQFLDYVQRLDRHREGRYCAQIHLSGLKSHNRRDHHIRIAANILDTPIHRYDGRIFVFANHDILISTKDADAAELDDVILKLRYLFSDDPLAHSDPEEIGGFCTIYNVESDYAGLLEMAEKLVREEERRATESVDLELAAKVVPPRAIDPQSLASLEAAIANADVSGFIRRQPVCVIAADLPPEPVFKEVFVGIKELSAAIAPGVEVGSDLWLFRHLTTVLDRRVLARLIEKDDTDLASHFSINLNISTILQPEFLAFNAEFGVGVRGTILMELQLVDIFQDFAAYRFARDFLRELGYRICVDGISHLSLPFIDREMLGADMMKILWHPDVADENQADLRRRLKSVVRDAGTARIVMARCDDEQAVVSGREIGISLYQGHHIDRLLAHANQSTGAAAMSMKQAVAAGRSSRR